MDNGDQSFGLLQLWPGAVSWPDFLSQRAAAWWTAQLQAFYDQIPLDGVWLDMNEPSNFCTGDVCVQYGGHCTAGPVLQHCRRSDKPAERMTNACIIFYIFTLTLACSSCAGDVPASTSYGCSLSCQNGAAAAGSNAANLPPAGGAVCLSLPRSLVGSFHHVSHSACLGSTTFTITFLVQVFSRLHTASTMLACSCPSTQRCVLTKA